MTWQLCIIVLLLVYSIVVTFYCFRFAFTLLRVQDTTEEAISQIDESHESISEILKIPVYYDSPEVKRVLQEIINVQRVMINIASSLSNSFETDDEENELDEKQG